MITGPRKLMWIEGNDSRCMGTGAGAFATYKGEYVIVIAGRSIEECERLFAHCAQEAKESSE